VSAVDGVTEISESEEVEVARNRPFITANTTQVVAAGPAGQTITIRGFALIDATITQFHSSLPSAYFICSNENYDSFGLEFTCQTDGSADYSGHVTANVTGPNTLSTTAGLSVIAWARPVLRTVTTDVTAQPNANIHLTGWGLLNLVTSVPLSSGGACTLGTNAVVGVPPSHYWDRTCTVNTSPFNAGNLTATVTSSFAPALTGASTSLAAQVGTVLPYISQVTGVEFSAQPGTLLEIRGYSFGPAASSNLAISVRTSSGQL